MCCGRRVAMAGPGAASLKTADDGGGADSGRPLCAFAFAGMRGLARARVRACTGARGCGRGRGQVDEDLPDLAAVEAVCRAELARAAALPASGRDAFLRALPKLQWPPE